MFTRFCDSTRSVKPGRRKWGGGIGGGGRGVRFGVDNTDTSHSCSDFFQGKTLLFSRCTVPIDRSRLQA